MDWIVVKVVVKDRTDGAGLENVLSPPLLESTPPPMVRLVPATELALWLGAISEREASWSVKTVPAQLLLPIVGGPWSSRDVRVDWFALVLLVPVVVVNVHALVPLVTPLPI